MHKEFYAVTPDDLAKCGEHCVKIQEEDFIKAGLKDEILEQIILTINPDESSSRKMKTTMRTFFKYFNSEKYFFYNNIIIIVLSFITLLFSF